LRLNIVYNLANTICLLLRLRNTAHGNFLERLQDYVDGLCRVLPDIPHDLSPPRPFFDILQRCGFVLDAYASSLLQKEDDFAPILTALVDPMLQLCTLSADKLDVEDRSVLHINAISHVQALLRRYPFTRMRLETLSLQVETYMDALVQGEVKKLLRSSGIADKLSAVENHDTATHGPLSKHPGMDDASVSAAARMFYGSIFGVGTLVLPRCDYLASPQLRKSARDNIALQLSAAYRTIYQAVNDPSNAYKDPASILQHSAEQVATLLDV
jgi:conserved oligomeric Golgi complex subunit 6